MGFSAQQMRSLLDSYKNTMFVNNYITFSAKSKRQNSIAAILHSMGNNKLEVFKSYTTRNFSISSNKAPCSSA